LNLCSTGGSEPQAAKGLGHPGDREGGELRCPPQRAAADGPDEAGLSGASCGVRWVDGRNWDLAGFQCFLHMDLVEFERLF